MYIVHRAAVISSFDFVKQLKFAAEPKAIADDFLEKFY